MSKTFQLPPGATGIDHHSGASFPANRRGRVTLPDKVARDFVKNGALRHYDVIAAVGESIPTFGSPDDRVCPQCFRTAFDYEEACPRCGAPLPTKEATTT